MTWNYIYGSWWWCEHAASTVFSVLKKHAHVWPSCAARAKGLFVLDGGRICKASIGPSSSTLASSGHQHLQQRLCQANPLRLGTSGIFYIPTAKPLPASLPGFPESLKPSWHLLRLRRLLAINFFASCCACCHLLRHLQAVFSLSSVS